MSTDPISGSSRAAAVAVDNNVAAIVANTEDRKKKKKAKNNTSGIERAKGFAAGTASGLTKLIIGHPFDTIKTRVQCSPMGTYAGPLHCLKNVVSIEGPRALYKGASPPGESAVSLSQAGASLLMAIL